VDLVQVKVGQKATLTFDAVSDLTISGTVAQIDTLATASQGVVNYTVKIAFDTDDDRIRPGMSVTASIITEIKQDVLAVPNSAVKTNTQGSYVEIFDDTLTATATNNLLTTTEKPKQQSVVIGLANDSLTEIVSGLKAGDLVVSRTVSQSSSSNTNSSSGQNRSILQTVGGGGQRGNDMPIPH